MYKYTTTAYPHNQHVLHKTLYGGKAKSRKVPQREIEAGVGGKLQQFIAPKLASPRKVIFIPFYVFLFSFSVLSALE
uniref:Uncharacterized protein n=1 Tax=Solanum tuberosum TaxID=4113 RepID=M0ZKF5_SOLTU